ncbi:MAG: glycosyltransferase [Alphaproteobacteria bacterium]|jgi:glycosyltransferase involved in cell wall biosynthesis|nr:glycosyltransferase [Alphaproteobacteria bacterium]
MKVLHVIAGAAQGGAETFFADTVRALAARGVAQHAVARAHPLFLAAFAEAGVTHEAASFSPWGRWRTAWRIRAAVRRERPDVVHAWMARAASCVPKGLPVPVLGWFGGPYDLKYYCTVTHFAGVTRGLREYLVEKTGRAERCYCLHTFGTLAPTERTLTRAEFGLPEGAPVALLLSRMHWKKGVDTLLHATAAVPGLHLLLAGDGPQRAEYEALAHDLGLSDRAHFLGWRTDRAALLALADVCVLSSRCEAFGTVMAEAWGAGVPLIACAADGPRQYVQHGENGLLAPVDDAPALAGHIRAVLGDKALAAHLVAGGRATYEALFTREVATDALLTAYRQIAQEG